PISSTPRPSKSCQSSQTHLLLPLPHRPSIIVFSFSPSQTSDSIRFRIRMALKLFAGGTEMAIATINPATGQLIKSFEALSDAQLEVRLQKAADAFSNYRNVSFAERAQMMLKAAAILDGEKEAFARMMTTEMGK